MFDEIATLDLRHWLLLGHVVGLVVGFGSAITIEVIMLRSLLSARTSPIVLDFVVQASKLTSLGLAVLWLTGIGFLLLYLDTDPGKLANAKIHAKVAIVLVLTTNGWCIHRFLLPVLWRHSGAKVLRKAELQDVVLFAVCGSVSAVSWIFPLIFGLNAELNNVYSFSNLFAQYVFAVAAAMVVVVPLAVYQCKAAKLEAPKNWIGSHDASAAKMTLGTKL